LNYPLRSTFDAPPISDEFGYVLGQTLPRAIPRVYLEDFSRLQETQPAGRRLPRVIVSANGWHQHEEFKLYAANCMDDGSVLAAAQHGGAYGTFRLMPQERHEVKSADAFFTWGWKYEQVHRPLPSIQLSRLSGLSTRRRTSSGGWLMITNIVPRYVHRFESIPMAAQFQDYMKWQARFITALGSFRAGLTIRAHPGDYGQGVKQRIREADPKVKFDTDRPSVEALATASLVIIDHPVTTMLESLVMNRPTILFWEPKWWEERSEARFLFARFRELGVLFDSPETAAEAACAIATRVDEWWSTPGIQQVRQLALDHYALASSKWVKSWAQGLLELSERAHVGT
jgi:putative transferase (TIGR04331 family)